MAGRLIVVEGLDGAGTTTLVAGVVAELTRRGIEAIAAAEPTSGPFGTTVRAAIEHRVELDPVAMALGFAADRADHLAHPERGITATLDQGTWVVCDRYVASSIAYQGAQGLDPEWVATVNRHARRPDLAVFVDTPLEECLRRITTRQGRADLFERREALVAIEAVYRRLLDAPELAGPMASLDGTASPDELVAAVLALIDERRLR